MNQPRYRSTVTRVRRMRPVEGLTLLEYLAGEMAKVSATLNQRLKPCEK